ncbi:MAG TPA: sulfite exporter TauE/SafE family protein [Planctomycetota bacterium]
MKTALLIALVVLAAAYVLVLARAVRRGHERGPTGGWWPSLHHTVVGFVTNFFDSLGIGNFAPTTVWFRAAKLVPDERIPGTMNVGHTLPVMLMGLLFIDVVEVEPATLVSMIGAAVVGAWFGAGLVSRLPRRQIQIGMGLALLAAAVFMAGFQFAGKPAGADALGLELPALLLASAAIAALGALMTIGVGLYAPCMVLVRLLGMNPIAAFPIMMGACAFLMPFASTRFLNRNAAALRPSLGLTLGGLPGVLLAVLVVKSLPLDALRWLVVAVVLITAVSMLRSASRQAA